MENEVMFVFLLQVQQKAANRFIRRYDGPFLVVGHVHGRQDLLQLKHVTTGKQLGPVNIEKIMVVPDGDPCADIRLDTEQEQPLQIATPSLQEHNVVQPLSNALSPDLNKDALSFGQYLSSLSKPQCYAPEACKAVNKRLTDARDILNRPAWKTERICYQMPFLIAERLTSWGYIPPCQAT